jgi:GTP-binding protein HflX
MDQQTGGMTKARGPGETESELLVRRLDGRLSYLRRGLAQLTRAAAAQRTQRADCGRVVLVGYTNAGKTSLMNALTGAGLSVRDRPFETLDTTSRALTRHGGDVLLSDTVGFIRRLPDRLSASFESTLAEVSEASLLLVTVDVSNPEVGEHLKTTRGVLDKLGAGHIPQAQLRAGKAGQARPHPASAHRGLTELGRRGAPVAGGRAAAFGDAVPVERSPTAARGTSTTRQRSLR